jgi:hypothetical protein
MSRRTTASWRLFGESVRDFGMFDIGARLASIVRFLLACGLAGGCLVTDQAQLAPTPNIPPVVLAADYPLGSVLRVNTNQVNEVRIPLRVRDEDTQEVLKTRFRINSGSKIGTYACPEPTSHGTGALIREDSATEITIPGTQLARGACSLVEFVVSASFVPCEKHPEVFDITTPDDEDLGRATFWIWETSTDPLTNPIAARALIDTCPAIDYSAQSAAMDAP